MIHTSTGRPSEELVPSVKPSISFVLVTQSGSTSTLLVTVQGPTILIITAAVQLITAPAHPPATEVAVYTALLSMLLYLPRE